MLRALLDEDNQPSPQITACDGKGSYQPAWVENHLVVDTSLGMLVGAFTESH